MAENKKEYAPEQKVFINARGELKVIANSINVLNLSEYPISGDFTVDSETLAHIIPVFKKDCITKVDTDTYDGYPVTYIGKDNEMLEEMKNNVEELECKYDDMRHKKLVQEGISEYLKLSLNSLPKWKKKLIRLDDILAGLDDKGELYAEVNE